jgi:serine/threonine-protein kinase
MASVTLGKYRLIAELGRGGMAEVFLAVTSSAAMSFSKLVVLKKPREHLADDVDFMTMLVDEARIAARLNHPHLVQTLEVGEVNGQYFLTMEYLDGQPLHRILSRARATLPQAMHLSILADVLGGIHYAHQLKDYDGSPLQIVHRDVTPHNCFITYEGQTKVVDFGIAKAVGRASETRHGVVKGKTAYMAPEQACGQHVDGRVDVFAVGVMVFEAAVRGRMWKGVSETDIIRRLVGGAIPSSPKAVDPTVDNELDRICRKALMHAPGDRYATAQEFQADLEGYLASKGTRPSGREIGGYIATLFADKRATTDKIIEGQLAHLKADARVSLAAMPRSSGDSALSPSSTTSGGASGATATLVKPESAGNVASATDAAKTQLMERKASLAPPAAPPPAMTPSAALRSVLMANLRGILPLLLAALILAIATATMVIVSVPSSNASPPTVATGKTITVTLRATPLETRFSIDNGPLQDNPFVGQYEDDGKDHLIRAQAPGYPPNERTVTFKDDISMRFTLAPARPGATAPTGKK